MGQPLHKLSWQRQDQPILSAMTTNQDWCRVTVYSPSVIRLGDTYKMWYLGNSSATRLVDMDMGYVDMGEWING